MTHPILQGMTTTSNRIAALAIEYAVICQLANAGYVHEAVTRFVANDVNAVPDVLMPLHHLVRKHISPAPAQAA